jgi:hypothetical protein
LVGWAGLRTVRPTYNRIDVLMKFAELDERGVTTAVADGVVAGLKRQ